MTAKDPDPRIPRLEASERSEAAQRVIDVFSLTGHINVESNHVLNTFAQHPPVAEPFLVFNRYLLKASTLPVRLRQIAIMRVAWKLEANYVWSSHLRTSLRAGLEDAVFDPVKVGASSPYWHQQERCVLEAVDQFLEQRDVDDTCWQALSGFLDQRQLLDFLFTLGAYMQLALVCKVLRIEREDALVELAERYGAPVTIASE